jgi:hypothetical protein
MADELLEQDVHHSQVIIYSSAGVLYTLHPGQPYGIAAMQEIIKDIAKNRPLDVQGLVCRTCLAFIRSLSQAAKALPEPLHSIS